MELILSSFLLRLDLDAMPSFQGRVSALPRGSLTKSKTLLLSSLRDSMWFGGAISSGFIHISSGCDRRSTFTARMICSIFPRYPKVAISRPSTKQGLGFRTLNSSIPGKNMRGSAATTSGYRLLSAYRSPQVTSDESPISESDSTPYRKRKVAMWIGYVGTAFKGLQLMRGPEAASTIEYQLEKAIYKAGGILDTNYGHLEKLSWSRSSRTDKGVHSLSTVIALKMEIPSSAWVGDPDGLFLAENINAHLPPTIQVFGVVPVSKSFEARRFCCNRTYQYLLPASLIGLSEGMTSEKIGEALENFRSILNTFEGRFAFHNYTIRKLYRADTKAKKKSWGKHESRDRAPSFGKPVAVEDKLDEDIDSADPPVKVPLVTTKSPTPSEHVMAYWLDDPNPEDKLSASHFRRILECSCGGLETFGGVQFIRISITGESFMVHQIRKMVATAVAISRGVLPDDIIPLSLCRHSRVVLPLAPSEGLVLARNSFYPFRQLVAPTHERKFLQSDVGLSRLKELPKLEITKHMSEKVDIFWRDALLPELIPQLDSSLPVWSTWLENLSKGAISDFEIEKVRTSYTNWREESQLKMEEAAAAAAGQFV